MSITAGVTLLNAVTSTGASDVLEHSVPVRNHTLQVTITGAPSAVSVALLGSLDNSTFVLITTHAFDAGELTATKAMFFDVDKPMPYIKADLTVLTAGTAPTVTVKYVGGNSSDQRKARLGQF
ncbi:MAG: hypothetical protein JKX85_04585 [Phycisphaeraceae bacterium]|nr:hypothetical protein [Phycisphaeraceae bacterium]